MGTTALLAALCWLASSDIGLAKNVNSSKVVDHFSEASAPRLYRNVPAGVYASAAPYGAYSIQFPRLVTAPKTAASQVVPILQNINGYLRDSYGNRFTGPPHAMTYKAAFPQQYVQIQELPDHLAQPLSASASPFQFQQTSPSQFTGAHFSFPSLQSPTPTPINHFIGSSQPLVYGNIRNLASPSSSPVQLQSAPSAQQQSTSQKAAYSQDQASGQPTFQRLQEVPAHNANSQGGNNHKETGNLEASPAQTAITTVVNGKKTVINVETNPPLPLLDLSLLEPLTFANPLVPQVQHFLPRIHDAVYHKLPQPNIKGAKNYQKEFVVQKTKSYDSGHVQGKPQKNSHKKKQKKITQEDEQHVQNAPPKPKVIITSTPNESPEFSYEINSPNYKETYKEKAIKYNKETNSEPVHYAYGKNTENEPVTYSYTHHSKEPAQIKQVHYENNGKGPTHLIYNFKPDEQLSSDDEDDSPQREHQSEDSGESNEEIEKDAPIYNQRKEHYDDAPKSHYNPEQRKHYEEVPRQAHSQHSGQRGHYEENPKKPHNSNSEHKEYNDAPKKVINFHPEHREHFEESPRQAHNSEPKQQYEKVPTKARSHTQEHREHHPPRQEVRHEIIHHNPPKQYSEPIEVPLQNAKEFEAITPEYDEDIRLLPTHAPHVQHPSQITNSPQAAIKVDPSQHVQHRPRLHSEDEPSHQSPNNHQYERGHHHSADPHDHKKTHEPAPHVHEQSKLIIMQEETPEEMHSLREQTMSEMIDREENNEEDFEKAYKNSAIGFPAFERQAIDIEKHIYDPRGYGIPRDHAEYVIEHAPFQQYQEEGDSYPKSSRANYKDARDKNKDVYYLDYSVARPQSLRDRFNQKEDYFKLYKQQRPERYFTEDDKQKEKPSAKYSALPTYNYNHEAERNRKQFEQYKAAPQKYVQHDYSKAPHDNSAFASRPRQWYKSRTHFVEPQFQYGFEPISLPRLLDSELAAMASNNSPESEKPGMRKKVYKENWYIKKTSTSGGEPAS